MVTYIIISIIAYLIGSVNFGVIISKKMAGFDVREKGSGNAGSTNVLRTVGKKAAAITLVCDILKGVVSVLIAVIVGKIVKDINPAILVELAAFFVIVGHTFPVFFKFKGGKGVATSLGIVMLINWKIGLICLVFALAIMALTKMVSFGSISTAVLFAVLVLFANNFRDSFIVEFDLSFIVFAIALAALVIFNHRSNLKRIMSGTENKLSFKKKTEENKSEKEEAQEKEVEEKEVEETAEGSKEK